MSQFKKFEVTFLINEDDEKKQVVTLKELNFAYAFEAAAKSADQLAGRRKETVRIIKLEEVR